jgi:predicted nucleic acid-binding protein
MPSYVLDTSAILTVLQDEPGTRVVLDLLESARSGNVIVYLPFMTLMELEYQSLRRFGPGETQHVLNLVSAWPTESTHSTDVWRHEAATVKATASVSVADAWICGLARLLNAELVHKDPEYDTVPELRAVHLPYKPQTG